MPATKKKCESLACNKHFWATRSDAMYCSEKCRAQVRSENAKFKCPVIPQSGIPGITYNRLTNKWTARWKEKYIGSFKTIEEAHKLLKEVQGENI